MRRYSLLVLLIAIQTSCSKKDQSGQQPAVNDPAAAHVAKLKDGSDEERKAAIKALAGMGEQAKSAVPDLERLAKEAKEAIRFEAAEALQAIAPESAEGRSGVTLLRFKRIGLGMHLYHEDKDTLPPTCTVVTPKDGNRPPRPGLSWRVLLLPYVGEKQLFAEFKLDEPWDSEHNKKLIDKMPAVYAPPVGSPTPTKTGETHLQVFTFASPQGFGVGATPFYHPFNIVFQKMKPCRFVDIVDGTSNTFLVAEAAKPVIWTKPEDIVVSDAPIPDLGHTVDGVFHVVMGDGSFRQLSNRASAYNLRTSIGRADGMVNDLDSMVPGKSPAPRETAPVLGRVRVRGIPFTGAWVVLHTNDGREYGGKLGVDGSFLITGAPVGQVKVTLAQGDPFAVWLDNPDMKMTKFPPPFRMNPKYTNRDTSPLQIDVRASNKEVNLDLE